MCIPQIMESFCSEPSKLLKEAKPGCLIVPQRYTQPPVSAPSRQDLVIDSEIQTFTFHKHDILKIPLVRKLENIEISSQLANRLVPVELRPGLAVATVTGNLVVRDNKYTLTLLEDDTPEPQHKVSNIAMKFIFSLFQHFRN